MNGIRLSFLVATFSASLAHAQLALPSDAQIFGDEIAPSARVAGNARAAGRHVDKNGALEAAYAQTLIFRDDRQVHGALVEITKDEVTWQRPDTSAVLHFPRSEVRRIALVPQAQVNAARQPTLEAFTGPVKPVPATLKLPGADWLFGDATIVDGQNFTVQLGGETRFVVPRGSLEWLHFGQEPMMAYGFSGTALDMEGWRPSSAKMEVASGTLTVRGEDSIRHSIAPPKRFEVAFVLPADSEEGTRLWLQPFGPTPDSYGPGTMELRFGKANIWHLLYLGKFEPVTSSLPQDSIAEKGPVSYRVFYDGVAHRVVVLRNGRQIGDWLYNPPRAGQANIDPLRDTKINGICFDRYDRSPTGALRFNRIQVRPWNGLLPKESDLIAGRDLLGVGESPLVAGKLESLGGEGFFFSGVAHVRMEGTFVQFAPALDSLAESDARLDLGSHGAFNARNLEFRDGKARGDFAFGHDLEVPAKILESITFQDPMAGAEAADRQLPAAKPADLLIFRNGDALLGRASAAVSNGSVRWKSPSGQELEVQSGRIAGVHLGSGVAAAKTDAGATVELRNGERLRGKLVGLDGRQLRLEHPQLGAITLDRSRLWHLYPNPQFPALDGGCDPGEWTVGAVAATNDSALKPWVYLDGAYVQRGHGNNWDGEQVLRRGIGLEMERFELRVEANSPLSTLSYLLQIDGGTNASRMEVAISCDKLQLGVSNPPQKNSGEWREIPFQGKVPVVRSRVSLRIFVNSKTGTCDIFVNGAPLKHLGDEPNDRVRKAKYDVRFLPGEDGGLPTVLSNLWIGPWSGELPRATGSADVTVALTNGDVAPGVPKALRDGKLSLETELGPLEVPVESVIDVQFGGRMLPEPAAARIRLADGTSVNVDAFRWDGRELTAHSATLGDLRLPEGVASELIFDPHFHPPK